MTQAELAEALGLTRGTVSILHKRGMPLTSLRAANLWRERHAPPRKKPLRKTVPALYEDQESEFVIAPDLAEDPADLAEIRQSVKLARKAERLAWQRLERLNRNPRAPFERFRRASAAYIAARGNRASAEKALSQWKQESKETLLASEVRDIAIRPAKAAAPMLAAMPSALAPCLHGRNAREIEKILTQWCDDLATAIRAAI